MFRQLLIVTLAAIPAISYAGCESVGLSMESTLFNSVAKELNIDTSTVQRNQTKVEIIDKSVVSERYAKSLATLDHADAIDKGKATLPENDYFTSYYGNNTQSLTAKYTYINTDKKKDVFIASSIISADECSIRFNGYITLSREF
ncbi:Shiga toxin A subunit [Enterobacteriaceae bacterium]